MRHAPSLIFLSCLVSSLLLAGCGGLIRSGGDAASPSASSAAVSTAASPKAPDADRDGLEDSLDKCPATPPGQAVDSAGCTAEVRLRLVFQYEEKNATLAPADQERLVSLAGMLRDNPAATLRIEAHTDNVGSAESNLALSRERAETLSRQLTSLGAPAGRIFLQAHGANKPLAGNDTPEGRARNRRVELLLSGAMQAGDGQDPPTGLQAITFAPDSAVLTPKSRKTLEAIGRYLQQHPDHQARIRARNAAPQSGQRLDPGLSQARARSIILFLTRQFGVAEDQLTVEFVDAPGN